MLNYRIIQNKNIVTHNGETFIDLLSSSFKKNSKSNGEIIMVNKYYVARPDLISLAVYGTDEYADIICKVNGISNPFELNENDILFIPEIDYLRNCIVHKTSNKASDMVTGGDDKIQNQKSSLQKKKNEKRSPNEQVIGDSTFVIDKSLGMVFY